MNNQLAPVDALKKNIKAMEGQFAAALPKHIKSEKFTRVVMTAISNTPSLVELERASFFSACMKAAQDGLLPDGKEAAIVPFRDKAQYMPMVAGLRKKARNSGEISYMMCEMIYEKEQFDYFMDHDGLHFNHRPILFGERGDAIGVYSFAKLKDGEVSVEVMNKDQVMSVKKMSKGNNTPWNGPFATEMWKKTVMRRHSKVLPTSSDLELSLQADDNIYDLNTSSDKTEKLIPPASPNSLLTTIEAQAEVLEPEPKPEAAQKPPPEPPPTINEDEIPI